MRRNLGHAIALCAMLAGVSCSSDAVDAPPASPDRLEFRAAPVRAVAGIALDPAVQVVIRTLDGSIDASSTAAVSLRSRSSTVADTLRGTTTVDAVAGVATFPGLVLNRVSADTRLFARASGLTGAESAPLSVAHGEPVQLVFLSQPTGAVAGQPLPALRIELQDIGGNRVMSANGPVTVAISTGPAGAVITGASTADLVSGGASLADVRLPRAGVGYTLTVSLVGNAAVRSPITRVFTTVPAAPAALTFLAEPTASIAGSPIAPPVRVAILDALGNTITGSNAPISLDLAVAPAGTQLLGTASIPAAAGIATYPDIRIDRASASIRLRASSPGITPAISAIFSVGAP